MSGLHKKLSLRAMGAARRLTGSSFCQTGEAGATNLPTRLLMFAGDALIVAILLACLAIPAVFAGA